MSDLIQTEQTPGDRKRQAIFDIYTDNLQNLAKLGILPPQYESERGYLCPICLKGFDNTSNEDNPLTLEDAPPKALGGKANILTCKKCNNTAGTKIDVHLVERLREIDRQEFKPGTEVKVKMKIGIETFNATISVDKDQGMKIHHSIKNNHPEKLTEAMKTVKKGLVMTPEFLKSRVIPENLQYALLKTGYLLLFKKYGYNLILANCYDAVREQIQDPESTIYPTNFWFRFPLGRIKPGEYFVMENGLESMLIVFELITDHETYSFGTLLPLPVCPIEKVIEKLTERFDTEGTFEITLYPLEPEKSDYLKNEGNILALRDWLKSRSSEA